VHQFARQADHAKARRGWIRKKIADALQKQKSNDVGLLVGQKRQPPRGHDNKVVKSLGSGAGEARRFKFSDRVFLEYQWAGRIAQFGVGHYVGRFIRRSTVC
jgi:hypothetical protein